MSDQALKEIAIIDKTTGEVVYIADCRKAAAQWFIDKGLAKKFSVAQTCISSCLHGRLKSMYGYVLYPTYLICLPMPKFPAIVSIEVETCYNKWITIDRGYIRIMDRPTSRINWNSDKEIEAHVRGFDRLDGEDYYKTYEEPYIVDLITALIRDLLL